MSDAGAEIYPVVVVGMAIDLSPTLILLLVVLQVARLLAVGLLMSGF